MTKRKLMKEEDSNLLNNSIFSEHISKFPKMVQNMYYKPKVFTESELLHPDRYKKDSNSVIKDYFIYKRAVSRKDVTGKKITDIKYNVRGGGQMQAIKRKNKENKPDLLKYLFFRDSMSIKKCNNFN